MSFAIHALVILTFAVCALASAFIAGTDRARIEGYSPLFLATACMAMTALVLVISTVS